MQIFRGGGGGDPQRYTAHSSPPTPSPQIKIENLNTKQEEIYSVKFIIIIIR